MAYGILKAHNTYDNMADLKIKFDAMASHDITYVGIIQTARASGLTEFPLPYVLTNCHNSSARWAAPSTRTTMSSASPPPRSTAGEFVPAHQAVIHSYMRERYAAPGRMILGSDSHTRYGAYGSMAIGEGGPELARQLLSKTYDIAYPRVIAIHLTGAPRPGVGPQDVALALIGATFKAALSRTASWSSSAPALPSLHGLPLRHRRDDHRDRLPLLHLVHRRYREGAPGRSGPGRRSGAGPRRRGLL